MGKKEKLIAKITSVPNDLKYEEIKTFLEFLGYKELTKGKSSGSRVMFFRITDNDKILLHKPHGGNNIPKNYIKILIKHLKEKGDL